MNKQSVLYPMRDGERLYQCKHCLHLRTSAETKSIRDEFNGICIDCHYLTKGHAKNRRTQRAIPYKPQPDDYFVLIITTPTHATFEGKPKVEVVALDLHMQTMPPEFKPFAKQ